MGIFDIFKRKSEDEQMKIQAQEMEKATLNAQNFKEDLNNPFSMTIQDVFTITGRGTVVVGKVESGRLQINDTILIERTGKIANVKGIEAFRKQIDSAQAGDDIGILLENIQRNDVEIGDKLKK